MTLASFICGQVLMVVPLADSAPPAAEAHTQPASQPAVIRGLMFVGGHAHDFDAEPLRLAEVLKQQEGIDIRVHTGLDELTAENVATVDVLMFNACLDKGMDETKQRVLLDALRQGKGLVALHCALWCFQDWPEWRRILGGLVLRHDKFGPYEVRGVHPMHPIAQGVPTTFTITDEAYYLDERAPDICLIAQTVRTHPGRENPDPQVWTNRYMGGRVFVNAMGHDEQALFHPAYLKLLANGVRWAAGRLGPAPMLSDIERQEGFMPLFDGKTINGWRYHPRLWSVRDGAIVGSTHSTPLEVNSCAIADGVYDDFILRFSVKLVSGNSGVQFRSRELPNLEVAGYQVDIVPSGWGNLHEQNGRRRLADGWTKKAEHAVNLKDWNDMEVEARGRRIILKTNGVTTADYVETDESIPVTGIIALQLHRETLMEVHFTNLRAKPLDALTGREKRELPIGR
ncbi:MAG: ThuA domain-containing protein [Phycisphaerae bacterium]|nr:ThuA domain-containing protein [Phycisphaerae bacterium]